jgi:DNA-binding transcriptional MerR regulator
VESDLFTIGDLARASGLSVSALRFYDRAGLLVPVRVDPVTGYRWYSADQIRPARIVAGLRRVAMPLAGSRRSTPTTRSPC